MKGFRKNLLVLFKDGLVTDQARAQELESLTPVLRLVNDPETFCRSNELATRTGITIRPEKIMKEARHFRLRPFHFLINKN